MGGVSGACILMTGRFPVRPTRYATRVWPELSSVLAMSVMTMRILTISVIEVVWVSSFHFYLFYKCLNWYHNYIYMSPFMN